ncbi:MAG: peptidoglycan-binding protein [Cyanobacteria bacterium P01_A01_bin.45]
MENIAYLHLVSTYEDSPNNELVSLSYLLENTVTPDWKKMSVSAWNYMLPLVLALSVLSTFSSAMALQKGDRGPSVSSLQQQLQKAGYYKAPITRVYDKRTEDAVRRFQKNAGIRIDGVAGVSTLQKLENWRTTKPTAVKPKKPTVVKTSTAKKPVAKNTVAKAQSNSSKFLKRGNEGESVRILQERLRIANFYYGNATGIFGPITEGAVKRFQAAYNLDVDGVVGPQTNRKLPPLGIGGNGQARAQNVAARKKNSDHLTQGDRGEAVRVLQAQLIKAGYLKGEPNGYFGSYTANAVKRFQAGNYLAASGIAGPTTRGKLYRSINKTSSSEFNTLEIQRRLRVRGFYKGPLNGVLDKSTQKAIKQAQEFYGISLNDVKNGRYY